MEQTITSASTSINVSKLPKSSKMIPFELYAYGTGLDYGAGKFNNYVEFLKKEYHITLYCYDKYNRSETENNIASSIENFQFVMCNNVLNVIKEDEVIQDITNTLSKYKCDTYYMVYEGDKEGVGRLSRKDAYQRNQKVKSYLKFIPKGVYREIKIVKNMIWCLV